MDLKEVLGSIDFFVGLNDQEYDALLALCQEKRLSKGETLAKQGEPGNELYIIHEGFVEVVVEREGNSDHVLVNMGAGQTIGEMSLVDEGKRSATVRAIEDPTIVQVIRKADFDALCEQQTRIGYIVMRNIAADLSFKLRHRNLNERQREG